MPAEDGRAGWPGPVRRGEANCHLRSERSVGVGPCKNALCGVWEGIWGRGAWGQEAGGRESSSEAHSRPGQGGCIEQQWGMGGAEVIGEILGGGSDRP